MDEKKANVESESKQKLFQKSINEIIDEKNILDALSIDYTAVFYCDLNEDTLLPLKQGNYTNSFGEQYTPVSGWQSYSYRIRHYFDNFVIQESAPDFLERLDAENVKRHLQNNDRFAYRFRARPNQIGQQYFEVQIVRLAGEDGFKVVMGYRFVDDLITEHEKQKTQLENALAVATLNSEIIGAISKIYWLIYRMDLINGTYEEISAGQEVHRLTGKHGNTAERFREVRETVVSPEHQKMMEEFLDTSTLASRLQDSETISMEYCSSSGSWHIGRFIVKKRDANGCVTSVLYVVSQIDKQKQKEIEYRQRLLATAEEAKRANIAKTDFLRRMSHDIRTPINGIRGVVSIANHCADDMEKQQECRDKVMQASGFLLDLVNNVLDMNKLESGTVILEHKPFDMLDVLQETYNIIGMQSHESAVNLIAEPWKIQHAHLIGSPLHLRQVLQNVASNAVKYSKTGGKIIVTAEEIRSQDGKGIFLLTCSDNGYGMSKEFLQKAFEPFSQENHGARTNFAGTGLGLAITKQLIDLMGGSIKIESEAGVGTKVSMTIPFEIDTEYDQREITTEHVSEISLDGVHALLVEDNELNMEIAKFLLEQAGLTVSCAWNGREAVDMFRKSQPGQYDVILMDVMMPVMDGLAATKAIRAAEHADAATIPIFAMTANAFPEDVQQSKAAGMNEHLSKPLKDTEVLQAIQRYVNKEIDIGDIHRKCRM